MVPVDDEDGDTTAAHMGPAVGSKRHPSTPGAADVDVDVDLPDGADADDSTVQQLPDALDLERETSPTTKAPTMIARGPARRPMMTLLGTGPSRGSEPDEEEHESVTERAKLGVRVSASGAVNEVSVARASRGPKPARRSTSDGLEDDSEKRPFASSVELAARPRKPSDRPRPPAATLLDPAPPPSSPFSRPRTPDNPFDPPTSEAFEPPTAENVITKSKTTSLPGGDDIYDDESVTTRGPAVSEDEDGDSVTTRAVSLPPSTRLPVVTAPVARRTDSTPSYPAIRAPSGVVRAKVPVPAPPPKASPAPYLADGTEGTTKKLASSMLPAEDEKDSVTTQAPGHLTNMLRVIAATSSAPVVEEDEDLLPENRTAVMANRPYATGSSNVAVAQPASGSDLRGMPSPLHPHMAMPSNGAHGSESALRIAEPAPAPIDHASLAVLAAPMRGPHEGSLAPPPFVPHPAHGHGPPSAHAHAPAAKPPSYGALVAIVALLSVGVPIGVFYVLRAQAPETPSTREGRQVTSEVVKLNELPRPKVSGSKAAPSSSAKRR